ncbi:MAG: glycoside hydrolase family 16 protein [Bacteroidaceae bacterium]|nr:glycoside hydrolase family 16 protein [Bacteroidaceae bacterium]
MMGLLLMLLCCSTQLAAQQEEGRWVESINVLSPAPCSLVNGKVKVRLQAKEMTRLAAHTFVHDGKSARQVDLTPKGIELDSDGTGSFSLNMKALPHGPLTIQIAAGNEAGERDLYELQLYNASGKQAVAGIPDTIPAAAQGMQLAFSDDFDGPLSISRDGRGARYNAHKPTFGDFSGWPFADPLAGGQNPFLQRDTYLIIRAHKKEGTKGSTGLIATVDMDGKGFRAQPPFYMECRLMAHSAPGTWPAFWTVTNIHRGKGDELDIIEAYGGWGEGNPNSTGYWATAHFWGQTDEQGEPLKAPGKLIETTQRRLGTSWSQTFHTYGLLVEKDTTTYFLDDEEVWSHPTNSYSFEQPHVVLVNYAIGGASGWKINLDRYRNTSEMYVDYLRVFEKR